MSANYQWVKASGKAKVFSWQVTYQPFYPAWDTPYNVAIVELEEGVRMHSNIVDCRNDELRIGMRVEVIFEDANDRISLPKFRPVRS